MTALSDLLNDAKGDRSVDTLIAAAEKRGVEIKPRARATVYRALKAEHAKVPREETLALFAEVFQLDVREVRRAAQRLAGELGAWVPVAESAQLSKPVRDALDALIKAMTREAGEGHDRSAATKTPDVGPAQQPTPSLSVVDDIVSDLIAADEQETSISAEQEESDSP